MAACFSSLKAEAGTMNDPAGIEVLPDLKEASAILMFDVFELVAEGDHVGRAMIWDGVGYCGWLAVDF